jgi:hypothetical protein
MSTNRTDQPAMAMITSVNPDTARSHRPFIALTMLVVAMKIAATTAIRILKARERGAWPRSTI